jgi:hypothetical protein
VRTKQAGHSYCLTAPLSPHTQVTTKTASQHPWVKNHVSTQSKICNMDIEGKNKVRIHLVDKLWDQVCYSQGFQIILGRLAVLIK